MAKFDRLAAGGLLIPSNVGFVNAQKYWHRIANSFKPMRSKSLLPQPTKSKIILTKYLPVK
jgi:hypothetical protein